jgi:hypothetical protein
MKIVSLTLSVYLAACSYALAQGSGAASAGSSGGAGGSAGSTLSNGSNITVREDRRALTLPMLPATARRATI